eukprot:CAMPEP_0114248862 /NCGR_PEP_ID=MMETSP0058-20121206/13809_1 /TAXON_ID=36894 /ORGANISM="Pyramimonas parkeae, CCMP726" /LENGTH=167 /DNA_ID=CAMNT_0001362317 /DNA_START=364 /DNA_END=867 /DNA_ORIENTATION=-
MLTIRKLIATGSNINAHDNHGTTPLHIAAMKGRVEVIRLLIWLGADPVATCPLNGTAMHEAARYGRAHAVYALWDLGMDVNVPDMEGRTPLLVASDAVWNGDAVCVLVQLGAKLCIGEVEHVDSVPPPPPPHPAPALERPPEKLDEQSLIWEKWGQYNEMGMGHHSM